jgi:hypothetical protein
VAVRTAFVFIALFVLGTNAAHAEEQAGGPGFLFHTPRGVASVRVSWLRPSANSDIFTFVQQHLTLDRRDFNRPAIIVESGLALSPRVDLLGGVEYSKSTAASEYRDFVDNLRRPIVQRTDLNLINLTGSVKFSLLPKGQSVSRLAWVPRGFVPFVGAGGGMAWYRLTQFGDFVDFQDFGVFTDSFRSDGAAPAAHAFGGVDLRVWRGVALTMEGRYVWAHADLGTDFTGFEPIDLSGLRLSSGVSVVF